MKVTLTMPSSEQQGTLVMDWKGGRLSKVASFSCRKTTDQNIVEHWGMSYHDMKHSPSMVF